VKIISSQLTAKDASNSNENNNESQSTSRILYSNSLMIHNTTARLKHIL